MSEFRQNYPGANSGGQLYNNMPHWIDHAMEFFEDVDPEVQCLVRSSLSSGQAEDEVYITLTAPCHPIVRAEITCTGAFKRDAYMINGTKGSLRGNDKKLEWKYVDWSEMPVRNLDMNPLEGRVYCSEELKWECGSWEATGQTDNGAGAKPAPGPVKELYMSLYESIRNGAPQRITPQNVRRRVAVLEQCYRLNQIEFPAEVLGR